VIFLGTKDYTGLRLRSLNAFLRIRERRVHPFPYPPPGDASWAVARASRDLIFGNRGVWAKGSLRVRVVYEPRAAYAAGYGPERRGWLPMADISHPRR
jgi:hypothetical protein